MRNTTRLIVSVALACVMAGTAAGDPKKDKAAVAKLEELYAPIGKLSGAERVNRACADAAKLQEANNAFSAEKAPAGASVDNAGWADRAGAVQSALESLVAVCKAPDRKRKLTASVETAEQVVVELDQDFRSLFEAAKKRALPPSLVTFRSTFNAMKVPSKSFCAQASKLAKQVAGFARAPKGVDAATWQPAYDAVKASVTNLQCPKTAQPDEVYAGNLEALRGKVDALVAVVPAL